jgi:hypothetical protein
MMMDNQTNARTITGNRKFWNRSPAQAEEEKKKKKKKKTKAPDSILLARIGVETAMLSAAPTTAAVVRSRLAGVTGTCRGVGWSGTRLGS